MIEELNAVQVGCHRCARRGVITQATIDLRIMGSGSARPHCALCFLNGEFTFLQSPPEDDDLEITG